jgi:hypothetical protein
MEVVPIFKHTLMITFFVFVMMLLIDFIDTVSRRKLTAIMQGGRWRQYTIASFLGATPGCLGAFLNVSLYAHGLISFGALVGGMIATSGDEAFVMLSEFPAIAMALFGMLLILGICFSWLSDKLVKALKIEPCESCVAVKCDHCESEREPFEGANSIFRTENILSNIKSISFTRFLLLMLIISFLGLVVFGIIGPAFWNWKKITFVSLAFVALAVAILVSEHYLQDHIWGHIIKKHLFRVFLWTFGALLLVHWGLSYWNLDSFIKDHMMWALLVAALIGIIPESGPHLIFVMMYANGIVPFSVLFTASFVQDGHGMLPLLSYSIKDSILIKLFNLGFGIITGGILFLLGF